MNKNVTITRLITLIAFIVTTCIFSGCICGCKKRVYDIQGHLLYKEQVSSSVYRFVIETDSTRRALTFTNADTYYSTNIGDSIGVKMDKFYVYTVHDRQNQTLDILR